MRQIFILSAGAALIATPAFAADQLRFGPIPAWVVEQSVPSEATQAGEAPVAQLLNDAQVRFERGKITSFTELAIKVQSPEGLAAGNISFLWQPATDTVTVNKVHIIRDGKLIDVLKAGQTFTVARRESNMEAATLDGSLTANIQPEGLQVGDIIKLAVTTERVDPVMKGHVEGTYALWNGAPLEKGHARISWPATLKLVSRQTDDLPHPKRSTRDGWNILELSAEKVEPLLLPSGAPFRFQIGRAGEVSDFKSWSDVAELMAPLYKQAAVVPRSGPLRDEVEKIRKSSKSEKERAEKALQLVQERIRYVALVMGLGGYVPASAETTWSRRFGDCKAKSALLVALLDELGIESVPVLVHSRIGDALPERLPMVSYFDHVIVRAKLGGKTYWLDGTRSGDTDLDRIPVPSYGSGLPLEPGASLVEIVQPPLETPDTETVIAIDASKGIFAPAQFKIDRLFRGDAAREIHLVYSRMSPKQAQDALRKYWRGTYDYVTIDEATSAYDRDRAELKFSMSGSAKLPWKDGWWYVPSSAIAFEPDFSRAPGKHQHAPFEVGFPSYETTVVIVRLPKGFGGQTLPPNVKEKLAGVDYARTTLLRDGVLTVQTSERAVQAEISYTEALAAEARLKAIYDDDVYLRVPDGYQATDADVAALTSETPASVDGFVRKGAVLASKGNYDEAIAAFSRALELDPKNSRVLAARAHAYVAKKDFSGAERDLIALERLEPGSADMSRLRGLIQFSKSDLKQADQTLSKVLAANPRDVNALLNRGLVRMAQERQEEAIADFDAVLAIEPVNTVALVNRASAHYALEDHDKAFADSERALKSGTYPPRLRLMRANIYNRRGERELVLKEAGRLVEENPKSDWALVAAGQIFSAAGEREKAMDALDAALALERYAYIYINRAQVRPPSDYDGRLSDLDEALKLEPDQPDALALKAGLLLKKQRYSEAIELFDRAIKANPDSALHLRRGRAVALYKGGRTQEAEKLFADVRAESTTPADFNALCWAKATAGILLESALGDCRKALEMAPDRPSYLDSLGMVLLRLDRLDEAAEAYDRAIAKSKIAASYMGRAIVYVRKGDLVRAEADRAEALKLFADIESQFADYGLEFPATTGKQASSR